MSTLEDLYTSLTNYSSSHRLFDGYYEGTKQIPKLGIAIPPVLQRVCTVVGWPGTCVDVLEERLDFQGWDDDGKFDLEDIYNENSIAAESSMANTDCLLYGIAYIAISTGTGKDEPKALITAESPKHTTGVWNRRTRRLDVAFTRYEDEAGKFTKAALFEENTTTYYRRNSETAPWVVESVDNHKLGRVPVIRLVNRGRAGRREGKSEITRAIRSYTDTAVRTLLGMETNREFNSSPQRYVLGAKERAFTDENGNPIPGWKSIMGSVWNLERDKEWVNDNGGEGLPQVGQFAANPPGPYLEQVRGLSLMVSAETGMPPSYLGFATDNPPSADSIRALEARLVKRSERRIGSWDPGYTEVGQIAALVSTGRLPKRSEIVTSWRDPATPTKAADADRASKLVAAQILPADPQVAREMAGLTPKQIRQLEKDATKAEFKQVLLGGMTNVPPATPAQPVNPASSNGVVVPQQQ